METKVATVTINHDAYDFIMSIMNGEEPLDEDDSICFTATFSDKMQMDVKVCGTQDEDSWPWMEAVLFSDDGSTVAYTDIAEDYDDVWELTYNNTIYRTIIKSYKKSI